MFIEIPITFVYNWSMKILFKNARILSLLDDNVKYGHVIIKDKYIKEVTSTLPLENDFDEVIDCQGNLLMPGFKNAHTHSAMTFLRSVADDSSLHDWLFKEIFPREANLRSGCVKDLSKVALLEYLTSGVTACLDQYFYPEEFKEACEDFGFRSVSLGMFDKDSRPKEKVEALYKDFNTSELCKMVIGMHSEYTANKEMFDVTSELIKEFKSPFYTHLGETIDEVEGCLNRRNMSPLKYFNSLGFFDYGGAIFHGVYLDDEDMKLLHDKDITVVSCPCSNMKLASGVAEIKKLLDMKVNIALGTDGPASNNGLDMFREMYLVTGLQKLVSKDPISIPAFEVIKMATVNGAKAMGLEECKYLSKGQLADIIMIDLSRPSMQPINNIINNLVYSGSKDCVKMTMINGKILYFDGKFRINEDINDIYSRVQKLTDELKIIH